MPQAFHIILRNRFRILKIQTFSRFRPRDALGQFTDTLNLQRLYLSYAFYFLKLADGKMMNAGQPFFKPAQTQNIPGQIQRIASLCAAAQNYRKQFRIA